MISLNVWYVLAMSSSVCGGIFMRKTERRVPECLLFMFLLGREHEHT